MTTFLLPFNLDLPQQQVLPRYLAYRQVANWIQAVKTLQYRSPFISLTFVGHLKK